MAKKLYVQKITAAFLVLWLFAAILSISSCVLWDNEDARVPYKASEHELVVRFLDVGQGDSCLISLPNGETMLIDTGTKQASEAVTEALEGIGVERIDYFILTHPHEDHIGGAAGIIEAFEIGELFMPRTSHTTITYEKLLYAIEDKGLFIIEAKEGETVIGSKNMDLRASFLGPTKHYDDLNDMSAVLVLEYGSTAFLFTGDIGVTAEKDMLGAGLLSKVDVLKVAHHGSGTSTGAAFLEATAPTVAVISVGEGNSYGHPSKAALDRLEQKDVRVFRTDIHGTVVVTSDGESVEVDHDGPK